jgi:hypothetical protein
MVDSLGPIATFSAPLSRGGVHFTRGEVGLLSLVLSYNGKSIYIYISLRSYKGVQRVYIH